MQALWRHQFVEGVSRYFHVNGGGSIHARNFSLTDYPGQQITEQGIKVFDRDILRQRRDRAAPTFAEHGFLKAMVAEQLMDRLADIKRPFPRALDLGCHLGDLAGQLKGRELVVATDLSARMIEGVPAGIPKLICDEEFLPFGANSFELVASALSLHWVNDLPGTLAQINRMLTPDGLVLIALIGGESLRELRASWLQAEAEIESGASPRVSPFIEVTTAAQLLQRAGFVMPVADIDTMNVTYESAEAAMRDLHAMGETNLLVGRQKGMTRRATFARAAEIYEERFSDERGRVTLRFDIITMTGWKPGPNQPVPLKPGSATSRLADALNTDETKI